MATLTKERQVRDEGAALAEAAAGGWLTRARKIILNMSRRGTEFNANMVRKQLEKEGYLIDHKCAMGSLFVAAARSGLIQPVGIAQCNLEGAHVGHIRTWKGS